MESRVKPGLNGVESQNDEAERAGNSTRLFGEIPIRAFAVAATLVAALVMGLDSQTTTIPFKITPTLPPLPVAVTAKWFHSTAFIYHVIINAVACLYAAMSLVVSLLRGSSKKCLTLAVTLGDLVMVALLFSNIGAATDFGLLGLRGNSHVRWNKVCGVYGKFCHKGAFAVAFSFLGAQAFLILVIISIVAMHRRSK
ncbi:hypothetical protein LUZ60_011498 [Juncus effusus]|nr:hypothetical protein LUZ60_011498 [Juncus effusus]